MKKFVLVISTTLAIAYSAYAQEDGQYVGSTSQGAPILFMVTGGGACVEQLNFSVTLACPSGANSYWGASSGSGCQPIQPDGSFSYAHPPMDGAGATFVLEGFFVGADATNGTIDFQAAALHVKGGEVVDTQLCDSNIPSPVTWSAALTAGPTEPLKFDRHQNFTYVGSKDR